MTPYSISGYPHGADADTIGALILAGNGVMHKSGTTGKRTGYFNFNGSVGNHPAVPVYAMYLLDGEVFAVTVEAGVLKLRRYSTNVAFQLSTDLLCRNTPAYRKVFDDMLDTFLVQEGKAVQINCFPAMTADALKAVESGAPRCREIALVSEVDASTLVGGSAMNLGIGPGERCAYRAVFSYVRANGAEVSGAPSGRLVYSRGMLDTPVRVCPQLTISLPYNVEAYYIAYPGKCYISLYRSTTLSAPDSIALGTSQTIYAAAQVTAAAAAAAAAADPTNVTLAIAAVDAIKAAATAVNAANSIDPSPNDDMNLVYKYALTDDDIVFHEVGVTDVCPPGMTGEALYTNAALGGSNVERWMPPRANSVAVFKDTCFYGGAVDRFARVTFNLIATPHIYAGPIVTTATEIKLPTTDAAVPVLAVGDVVSLYCTAPALTADYVVNGAITVAAGFIVIPVTAPPGIDSYTGVATFGKLTVTVTDPVGGPTAYAVHASLNAGTTGTIGKFQVPLHLLTATGLRSQRDLLQSCAASICQGINMTLWNAGHNVVASNLATGTLATGTITIEADQATALSIAASDTASDYRSMAARLAGVLTSSPDAGLNSVWWSTPGIYDHVCPSNRQLLGAPDKEVLKVVATRDTLYVFKEDGTWIHSGDGSGNWQRTELSLELRLLAPSLVTVYKDQVYAATNMGIVELSGGSITVISAGIRDAYQRMLQGRVSPALAYACSLATFADLFCNSCAASWQDGTITFSIPTYVQTTEAPGVLSLPSAVAYQIFTYCHDSQQWLCSVEHPSLLPAVFPAVGFSYALPLMACPAIALGAVTYIDVSQRQVVRLPLPATALVCGPAMEIGSVGSALQVPHVFSDEVGLLPPQGCDVVLGTTSAVGGNQHHLLLNHSGVALSLLPTGIIDPNGPDQYYWMNDAGDLSRISEVVTRNPPEFYTDTAGTALAGTGAILLPITIKWRFAPIGTGATAINFNQIALLLSRAAKATRLQFTFWLDDGVPYPYTTPTKVVVAGSVTARNLVRVEVPSSVTRGSRLTIELYHNMPNERLELSKLLLDIESIAGEEVNY